MFEIRAFPWPEMHVGTGGLAPQRANGVTPLGAYHITMTAENRFIWTLRSENGDRLIQSEPQDSRKAALTGNGIGWVCCRSPRRGLKSHSSKGVMARTDRQSAIAQRPHARRRE